MKDTIRDLVDSEATEAEDAERTSTRPTELPVGVVVTRGHNRSRTLQVRLNEDELEQLQMIAKDRDLPVSTVARAIILSALAPSNDAGAALSRMEADLAALRRLVERS